MPPKPKLRRFREPQPFPEGELHPAVKEFLLTGAFPDRTVEDEVRDIPFEWARAKQLWNHHRRSLLAEGRRRGFGPFGLHRFDGETIPGLPQWRPHSPDARGLLRVPPRVVACPHCGSADTRPTSCLSRGAA
jgi:hypothetical protein